MYEILQIWVIDLKEKAVYLINEMLCNLASG
jgi:hypothetical protein